MTYYPKARPALKVARDILATAMAPIPVYTKQPQSFPAAFVTVDLVGGNMSKIVTHTARILVQCWATSGADGIDQVYQMCQDAKNALQNAEGALTPYAFVRGFDNIETEVNFPDPDADWMERWQFQGDLLVSTYPGS